MKKIVIVGGGIAGLSIAHAVKQRGAEQELPIEVVVLERGERPGGNIRSEWIEGYLCEWGPNGFLDSVPETLALVRALGLDPSLQISSDAARRRFVFRKGLLCAIPENPLAFLRTRLLSWGGKLRILAEPLARRRTEGVDETIHAFAARRIGREAADVLIDSMVSGVFAGDARKLSLKACFPKMWQMETDHGGLFRAMLALRRAKRRGAGLETLRPVRGAAGEPARASAGARTGAAAGPARAASGERERDEDRSRAGGAERSGGGMGAPVGRLTSFREGTEALVQALARHLAEELRASTPVRSVINVRAAQAVSGQAAGQRPPAGTAPSAARDDRVADRAGAIPPRGGWKHETRRAGEGAAGENADAVSAGHAPRFRVLIDPAQALEADAVVLACPSAEAARILATLDAEIAAALEQIESAPVSVVCVGYDGARLGRELDGFGFLVPRGEGPRILGVLWDSSIYPGRAPEGKVLLRAMIGGARDTGAIELTDAETLKAVGHDLAATMGIHLEPEFVRIFRHPRGIPQYTVGHLERLARIEARLANHPGLFLAGNSYRGVSINSCIAEAGPIADRILDLLVAAG